MSKKFHLKPGVVVNVFDLIVYADGIKITFADSPDGTERSAEHRGSFYLTPQTARRLHEVLGHLYAQPGAQAKKAEPNADTDEGS